MKFFKNPVAAFLLCLLIVLSSTLLSVHVRFGSKCEAVTEGFYSGVETKGYKQKAMAAHLKNIASYVDGLATIASNYDLDCSEVSAATDALKNALTNSYGYESYIYEMYETVTAREAALVSALSRQELSERDKEGMEQYVSSIVGAQSAMEASGYNESVREFLRRYDRFPTAALAGLAGVSMPQYFA